MPKTSHARRKVRSDQKVRLDRNERALMHAHIAEQGLTIRELSVRAGVTEGALSLVFNGRRGLDAATASRLRTPVEPGIPTELLDMQYACSGSEPIIAEWPAPLAGASHSSVSTGHPAHRSAAETEALRRWCDCAFTRPLPFPFRRSTGFDPTLPIPLHVVLLDELILRSARPQGLHDDEIFERLSSCVAASTWWRAERVEWRREAHEPPAARVYDAHGVLHAHLSLLDDSKAVGGLSVRLQIKGAAFASGLAYSLLSLIARVLDPASTHISGVDVALDVEAWPGELLPFDDSVSGHCTQRVTEAYCDGWPWCSITFGRRGSAVQAKFYDKHEEQSFRARWNKSKEEKDKKKKKNKRPPRTRWKPAVHLRHFSRALRFEYRLRFKNTLYRPDQLASMQERPWHVFRVADMRNAPQDDPVIALLARHPTHAIRCQPPKCIVSAAQKFDGLYQELKDAEDMLTRASRKEKRKLEARVNSLKAQIIDENILVIVGREMLKSTSPGPVVQERIEAIADELRRELRSRDRGWGEIIDVALQGIQQQLLTALYRGWSTI